MPTNLLRGGGATLPTLHLLLYGIAAFLAWWMLAPGLVGPFLLDDLYNLQPMAFRGGISDPEAWNRFVWGGISGPFGRPLSLLTFAANADTWPADPFWFKATNISIHLLLGLLLFVLALLILRSAGMQQGSACWIALAASLLWLFHPAQSSNVLYVIQRMTQLSAICIVLGAIGWMHGRNVLLSGRAIPGYLWMSLSVGVGVGVGVLFKENAVVLPLLILALLVTVAPIARAAWTPLWFGWVAVFLALPVALILFQFSKQISGENAFALRPFSAFQRLAVEGMVLWDYVRGTFLPRTAPTIFHEDWDIRAASPPLVSVFLAYAAWAAAIAGAWLYRRRFPVVSLGVLAFLGLHLLEAGPVSLEVYFLHRNYLPMFFLLLATIWPLSLMPRRVQLLPAVGVGILAMVSAAMLHSGALRWSDNEALRAHWVQQRPESLRAHHHGVIRAVMSREFAVAQERIERVRRFHPEATSTAIYSLLLACESGDWSAQYHLQALDRRAAVDWRRTETAAAVRLLDDVLRRTGCAGGSDGAPMQRTVDIFLGNPNYQSGREQAALLEAKAEMYRRQGASAEAQAALDARQRYRRGRSEDAWIQRAESFEAAGRYEAAAEAISEALAQPPYTALGHWLANDSHRQTRLEREILRLREKVGSGSADPMTFEETSS